jgi:hypothetical protein
MAVPAVDGKPLLVSNIKKLEDALVVSLLLEQHNLFALGPRGKCMKQL